MTLAAKLVQRGAHRVWACPCAGCGRTLAEVYDDRVVVKAGDRLISFHINDAVEQTCPRCASVSRIEREDTAA